jgi:hypothetical protein
MNVSMGGLKREAAFPEEGVSHQWPMIAISQIKCNALGDLLATFHRLTKVDYGQGL